MKFGEASTWGRQDSCRRSRNDPLTLNLRLITGAKHMFRRLDLNVVG
jgi:hypothetical protein